jgi:putative component of membrane protein insertase Oxa1/YidC/SpoIIIJ protein YidD
MTRSLFLTVLLLVVPVQANADGGGDPWDFERPAKSFPQREVVIVDPARASAHPIKQGFGLMLDFFQGVLSPIDGPKCPHYPTCSQFARESVSLYGPFWGTVMTGNRLAREYPGILESGHYPVVFKGQLRAYDPPEHEWLWGEHLHSHVED